MKTRFVHFLILSILVAMTSLMAHCSKSRSSRPDAHSPQKAKTNKASEGLKHGKVAQKIFYEQAKSLLRAGKMSKSVKYFKKAIEADPQGEMLANCYLGLGSALSEVKKFKEALAAYGRVVELRPDDPEAYRALAIGQEDAGLLRQARESLEQALALDGDQLSAYQDLATLYLQEKDLEGAKRTYMRYEIRRTALIKALGMAKSENRRVIAANALGHARDEETAKALGLALSDPSKQVRIAVIEALGRQGLAEGTGPLKALLAKAQDKEERQLIKLALELIANTPQPAPQAAPQPVAPTDADAPTSSASVKAIQSQKGSAPPESSVGTSLKPGKSTQNAPAPASKVQNTPKRSTHNIGATSSSPKKTPLKAPTKKP